MKKIIFLDIDGVLVKYPTPDLNMFNLECVNALNYLLERIDGDVVISSSWRSRYSIEQMQNILNRFGFIGKVIGETPKRTGLLRGYEILRWVEQNKCTDYVVVDDDWQKIKGIIPDENFILTQSQTGLTIEDVDNFLKNQ